MQIYTANVWTFVICQARGQAVPTADTERHLNSKAHFLTILQMRELRLVNDSLPKAVLLNLLSTGTSPKAPFRPFFFPSQESHIILLPLIHSISVCIQYVCITHRMNTFFHLPRASFHPLELSGGKWEKLALIIDLPVFLLNHCTVVILLDLTVLHLLLLQCLSLILRARHLPLLVAPMPS